MPVRPSIFDEDPASRTCSIWYVKRELGRDDFGDRRLVTYIAQLIAGFGFPPPLPSMQRGRTVEGVTAGSRWIRASVDQWLHDFLPPDNHDALDVAAMKAAAVEMDSNAHNLRLVMGGRA